MDLDQFDSKSISESTDFTAMTPPETVVSDILDETFSGDKISSSVPWPGSTFIIRSVSSGHVITLLNGNIVLAPLGGQGCFKWACVETKGWLGFKNPVSGRFLGHDKQGRLCCSVDRHLGWENFCVRMRPEGGYVLLMTHYERLWHVGLDSVNDKKTLAKVGDGGKNGIVWEFIKV